MATLVFQSDNTFLSSVDLIFKKMGDCDRIMFDCSMCTPEYQSCKIEKRNFIKLPATVGCFHNGDNMLCNQLSADDINAFQNEFYKDSDRFRQDALISMYCVISPFSRSQSAELTYYFQQLNGRCVQVCSEAFTRLLDVSMERIYHILLSAKEAETVWRISQEKFEAVRIFMTRYKCYLTAFYCIDCRNPFNNLFAEVSPLWFWQLYNEDSQQLYNTPNLWVCKSYFFAASAKLLNKLINDHRFKESCYRCSLQKTNDLDNIANKIISYYVNKNKAVPLESPSSDEASCSTPSLNTTATTTKSLTPHKETHDPPQHSPLNLPYEPISNPIPTQQLLAFNIPPTFSSTFGDGYCIIPHHMAKGRIVQDETTVNKKAKIGVHSNIKNNKTNAHQETIESKESSPLNFYDEKSKCYVCPICDKNYKYVNGFSKHYEMHFRYDCTSCCISFQSDALLQFHTQNQHALI